MSVKTHTHTGNNVSRLLPGMRNLKGNVCSPCFRVPVRDKETDSSLSEAETIPLLFPLGGNDLYIVLNKAIVVLPSHASTISERVDSCFPLCDPY